MECEDPRGRDITVGRPARNGKHTHKVLTHGHGVICDGKGKVGPGSDSHTEVITTFPL